MGAIIREATTYDSQAIVGVLEVAFPGSGGESVSDLVLQLLADSTAKPLISMVAESSSQVVGHALLSNAQLTDSHRIVSAKILAPLSVAPHYQGQGLGGRLIKEGLKRSMKDGTDVVFVLGDPGYYGRHGFVAAQVHGFEPPYGISAEHAEAWMVHGITAGVVTEASGRVVCADSLMDPKYWRA